MPPPAVLAEPAACRRRVRAAQAAGQVVGLVPTMGNLHAGHASLLRRARAECGFVVATIFVNPTQFDNPDDLAKYPRTPDDDLALCAACGVDAVFMPDAAAMYRPDASTRVTVGGLDETLCGASRPGHFEGVATVVAKLFNIAPADIAYFGRKDFQQAALVRRMARDLDFPIDIRLCPTVREADGLALSSRNRRLDDASRRQAPALHRALRAAEAAVHAGQRDPAAVRAAALAELAAAPACRLDYFELVDPDTLRPAPDLARPTLAATAAFFGPVRLIDNVLIDPAPPRAAGRAT